MFREKKGSTFLISLICKQITVYVNVLNIAHNTREKYAERSVLITLHVYQLINRKKI